MVFTPHFVFRLNISLLHGLSVQQMNALLDMMITTNSRILIFTFSYPNNNNIIIVALLYRMTFFSLSIITNQNRKNNREKLNKKNRFLSTTLLLFVTTTLWQPPRALFFSTIPVQSRDMQWNRREDDFIATAGCTVWATI